MTFSPREKKNGVVLCDVPPTKDGLSLVTRPSIGTEFGIAPGSFLLASV